MWIKRSETSLTSTRAGSTTKDANIWNEGRTERIYSSIPSSLLFMRIIIFLLRGPDQGKRWRGSWKKSSWIKRTSLAPQIREAKEEQRGQATALRGARPWGPRLLAVLRGSPSQHCRQCGTKISRSNRKHNNKKNARSSQILLLAKEQSEVPTKRREQARSWKQQIQISTAAEISWAKKSHPQKGSQWI